MMATVVAPQELLITTSEAMPGGIWEMHWKGPPLAGGQVTFSMQQVATAQAVKGAQTGVADRDTFTQYCMLSAGIVKEEEVAPGIAFPLGSKNW